MLKERAVTITRYNFSLDGETFARGYYVSDGEVRGDATFRLGSVSFDQPSPIEEGAFVPAQLEDGSGEGRLLIQKGRFLLSLRERVQPDDSCGRSGGFPFLPRIG